MKKIIKQPITKKPTKKIRKKAKLNFDKVINVNQATIIAVATPWLTTKFIQ